MRGFPCGQPFRCTRTHRTLGQSSSQRTWKSVAASIAGARSTGTGLVPLAHCETMTE